MNTPPGHLCEEIWYSSSQWSPFDNTTLEHRVVLSLRSINISFWFSSGLYQHHTSRKQCKKCIYSLYLIVELNVLITIFWLIIMLFLWIKLWHSIVFSLIISILVAQVLFSCIYCHNFKDYTYPQLKAVIFTFCQ